MQTTRGLRTFFALTLLLLSSCAKVPQESVQLSAELGTMIGSARRAHLELVHQYINERRTRVQEFVTNVWMPTFMRRFVSTSGVLDSLSSAPTPEHQGRLMLQFAEAATVEISRVRDSKMRALDEVERLLADEVGIHYDEMRVVNQALTAHLQSAADVTEIREDLASRFGLDVRGILPLDDINSTIEDFIRAEGSVEHLVNEANDLSGRVSRILKERGG